MYDFVGAQREWERLPVDDYGYVSARELLHLSDEAFLDIIQAMAVTRYGGWRNAGGRWRTIMGLDDTSGKRVLDFGCGVGMEALQFAACGNLVSLADINPASMQVAERALALYGWKSLGHHLVCGEEPFFTCEPFDIFYSNGVLHHTPMLPAILRRARELLNPGGEIRLMLYSDKAWRLATETEPPPGIPVGHPGFQEFVRAYDEVGAYAEPWWPEKMERAMPELEIVDWAYLTDDGAYGGWRLRCA